MYKISLSLRDDEEDRENTFDQLAGGVHCIAMNGETVVLGAAEVSDGVCGMGCHAVVLVSVEAMHASMSLKLSPNEARSLADILNRRADMAEERFERRRAEG